MIITVLTAVGRPQFEVAADTPMPILQKMVARQFGTRAVGDTWLPHSFVGSAHSLRARGPQIAALLRRGART